MLPRPGATRTLPVDSPLHQEIVRELLDYLAIAERHARDRHSVYGLVDRIHANYVDPADLTPEGRLKRADEITLVLPYPNAVLETLVSFWHGAMTARDPWVRLECDDGPEYAAEVMESLLHQIHTDELVELKLYGWLRDAAKYGRGAVLTYWEAILDPVLVTYRVPMPGLLGIGQAEAVVRAREHRVRKETQRTELIDPRCYFCDPRVPGWNPDAGEFVILRSWYSKRYLERQALEGVWFNTEALGDEQGASGPTREPGGLDQYTPRPSAGKGAIEGLTFFVRLVPAFWPTRERPLSPLQREEVWQFHLAGRRVITLARPVESEHGRFPVSVMDAHFEPHLLFSPGDTELNVALSAHMSWLINARRHNLRSLVHNILAFDPAYVNLADVTHRRPGGAIRLENTEKLSRPASSILFQVPVQDVTGTYLNDIVMLSQLYKEVTGAVDTLRGVALPGETTATEAAAVFRNAQARAANAAQRMWLQGVLPWVMMELSDVRQFLSEERRVRVLGEKLRELGIDQVTVTREALEGRYRVAPVDLTEVPHREAVGALLVQMLQMLAGSPYAQAFDVVGLIKEAAWHMGLRDIDRFVVKPQQVGVQVQPPEQVLRQAEAGNLVPAPPAVPPGTPAGPEALAGLLGGLQQGGAA